MKIAGKFPDIRLRRIRKKGWIRRLVSENSLSIDDLVLPIFIRDGKNKVEPIKSMPGVHRYSINKGLWRNIAALITSTRSLVAK